MLFAWEQMEPLLQVRGLTAEYCGGNAEPHRAVDGVSFDIGTGEVVGVMGESGCGKTTLALALLGLHDKERVAISGTVAFRGEDLIGIEERDLQKIRGAMISLISQEPGIALCPVRQVGEQIAEVMRAHSSLDWKGCRAEAEAWLERTGLTPTRRIWRAYPHQLSGGQRQRIVLAQALICKPQILIADEPTASLDARNQAEFVKLLAALKKELGLSVLLISHTPEMQASLADRVLVLRDGRIIEQGMVAKIFRNPAEAYTKAMLSRPGSPRDASCGHIPTQELASR
jgi:peptide/nickel transport system ATP-binding protein